MSTSRVLRNALPAPDTAPRVVLRGQPPAAQVEASPASPGVWVTEQQLDALKREWSDQAHDAGYAEGLRVAREAARQQAEADATAQLERELKSRDEKHAKAQADKWRSLATALAGQMQSLRDELQDQVSEWTFAATARLLGLRARADVGAAVRHVLDEAELDGPVTVLLHAQDLATVQHAHATDPAGWPTGVSFAASERVTLGGCQLQASAQTLDARLEVQLALLREALDRARHEQARQQAPATDA